MDTYQVALSWGLFGAAAVGCAFYYWPNDQTGASKRRDSTDNTSRRRKNEQDVRNRLSKNASDVDVGSSSAAESARQGGNAPARKRKVQTKEPTQTSETPAVVVSADEPEEVDMNTREFAEQMAQNRKGTNISSSQRKDNRVKTVKQSSALNTPDLSSGSSQAGAEADDDLSPAVSPSLNAGDVADMLEPVAPGPSTLRVTAPTKPQKEKAQKQSKEQVVESKKQRQNRQKVEAQRIQREEDEKQRKALEERQRRAAREARGEPARNGMPASKPPAKSAWVASTAPTSSNATTPAATENNAPLLDTFDAESTSSSNGGPALSTAATSTTSNGPINGAVSEEDQLAQAMRQSEDESGWTTVAQPKKQKKKAVDGDSNTVEQPVLTDKTNAAPPKPAVNGKPKGFQALEVEYEQRADADPSDASNWDA
ncbi:uncharacterized protein LTR77_006649 [Saxophila tyrrhenica]|uniref:Uncharacterized protein n=1 Tax=Saxophila tyrrhenica TaxID=1690608 RepID=A0AAV9P5Y9_9PEZI|nr:hypothetical protein LTR77_006649 [Saxophila tyrrhenica]